MSDDGEAARKYYRLDSDGEETNLQLYALRQARRYWREIKLDYDEWGKYTPCLTERCVFAIASMGLSLSQLLGQNNPEPADQVPSPKKLFKQIVREHALDPALITKFERFTYYYDGCRHFGRTIKGTSHRKIDELTFDVAKECFDFGLELWRTLLQAYGKMPGVDLAVLDVDQLEDEPEDC